MKKYLISWLVILTNALYIIASLPGDWLTVLGGTFLAIGSGWMHYEEEFSQKGWYSTMADWLGMYLFSLTVLSFLTNPWVMLLMIPIILLGNKIRDPNLIGVIVLLTCLIAMNWIALLLFGVGYIFRYWGHSDHHNSVWEDLTHSLWHVFTAGGYYYLIDLSTI